MTFVRRLVVALLGVAVAGGVAFWMLTAPQGLDAETAASLGEGDAARGEEVFHAAGCASCHAVPGADGEDRLVLAGGLRLETPFGAFVAPNISQHPEDGIGGWSVEDLANAMLRGVSPAGQHYYPAFPYTSYARMDAGDVADLFAYMKTLPAVEGEAAAHDLGFPYGIRRGLGLWKRLFLDDSPVVEIVGASEEVVRGQYLVEGAGHCGECHTPRNAIGGADRSRWLAGAKAPEGEGDIPNITPGEGGIGGWSEDDIAYFLESGFTPEFDSAGGEMAVVIRNLAQLPASDREAIAAYLKAVPAHDNGF